MPGRTDNEERNVRKKLRAVKRWSARLAWSNLLLLLMGGSVAGDGPRRWQSVWPKDHFVNPVPSNPDIMRLFEGLFERDEVRVLTQLGSEVRPFWYARAKATGPTERVLIYLHGDVPFRERSDPKFYRGITTKRLPWFGRIAAAANTDVIMLVRPGYFMAPGDTLFRRAPTTVDTMAEAISKLSQTYGYKSVALVGQSGGAMIAAAMMMRAEQAPQCVVLASGSHYQAIKRQRRQVARKGGPRPPDSLNEARKREFDAVSFDIGSNLDRVRRDPARRVFVLADRQDAVVPFAGQPRFVGDMAAKSHHAVLLELQAKGAQHHGLASEGVEIGLRCLNGETDQEIAATPLKSILPARTNDPRSNEKGRVEARPSQF
jgi:pimeloyl-ACP methyl ester carboxylesterase